MKGAEEVSFMSAAGDNIGMCKTQLKITVLKSVTLTYELSYRIGLQKPGVRKEIKESDGTLTDSRDRSLVH